MDAELSEQTNEGTKTATGYSLAPTFTDSLTIMGIRTNLSHTPAHKVVSPLTLQRKYLTRYDTNKRGWGAVIFSVEFTQNRSPNLNHNCKLHGNTTIPDS